MTARPAASWRIRAATILAGMLPMLGLAGIAHAQLHGTTPIGTWRTFDDAGQESGRVRISEQDGVLSGTVVAINDPAKQAGTCVKCTGDRKDEPVMGMQILRGMKQTGEDWSGGEILDPDKGSEYHCSMHVEDAGRTLVVRGYIGVPMLGRSQIWLRATD